jgi:hypothetical protein
MKRRRNPIIFLNDKDSLIAHKTRINEDVVVLSITT